MGAGLSMASVNKIKELANAREYSLALEIVDSQDLSKSLNPQFLRLCGDIYSHAGRYKDARRVLVMAHRLAPESKRVIFSLIELHLNAGHEELAKRYYDIYLFGSDDSVETRQAKYMFDNAHGEPAEKLIEYLESSYMHNMDYEWSFITYLLLIKLGRKSDAEALSDVYCATYKNSENSDCIGKIAAGNQEVDSLIYTYAKEWVEDDNEDESEVRKQELKLIEDDELRIHPKEAEITIMFEEVGEGVEELSKRKMKKLIKEHEKQERELEEKEKMANEEAESQDDEAANPDNKKTGLFKKLFKKSKPADEDLTEETITEHTDTSEKSEMKSDETSDVKDMTLEKESEETGKNKVEEIVTSQQNSNENQDAQTSENITDEESNMKAEAEIEASSETENKTENDSDNQTKKYKFNIEEVLLNDEPEQEDDSQFAEDDTDDESSQDNWEKDTFDNGETDMPELHLSEDEPQSDLVISVDEENDGFAAEADTIDDLIGEVDYNDTSDNMDSEKSETEKFFSKKKMEYVFEASDIIIDEDEDQETDDFTIAEDDEEEESIDRNEDADFEFDFEFEVKTDEDADYTEEAPLQTDEQEIFEAKESDPDAESNIEKEVETEAELKEAEMEDEAEQEEPEPVYEADEKWESEPAYEADVGWEPEPESVQEQTEEKTQKSDLLSDMPLKKSNLDFPVFKTDLFPSYNVVEVENNFDEIMEKAQDKMQANLLKEEQMQKEAEALLASLGIDYESATPKKQVEKADHKPDNLKNITASRDALKASLKISSEKREILRKIKEHR